MVKVKQGVVSIPKLDGNLKTYFENQWNPIWVFDVENKKGVWCNTASLKPWGKKSLREFQSIDFTDASRGTMDSLNSVLSEVGRRSEIIKPWTLYPNGKKPCSCILRLSGIDIDGDLCLLANAEMDVDAKDGVSNHEELDREQLKQQLHRKGKNRKQGNVLYENYRKLAFEVLKYGPVMVSVVNEHGHLQYQNIAAENYFKSILANYKTQDSNAEDKTNILYVILQGADKQGVEYAKMKEGILLDTMYHQHLRVPPFTTDIENYHHVLVNRQLDPISGQPVYVLFQLDSTPMLHGIQQQFAQKSNNVMEERMYYVDKVQAHFQPRLASLQNLCASFKKLQRTSTDMMREFYSTLPQSVSLFERVLELSTMTPWSNFTWRYIQLDPLLSKLVFRYQPREKDVCLTTNIDSSMPLILADIALLERILEILIRNAIRHTKRGTITIKAVSHIVDNAGCVVLSVIDEGDGISIETQESISANAPHHIGLGKVQKMVEQHGGSVFIISNEANGTTVTFSLPYRHDMLL